MTLLRLGIAACLFVAACATFGAVTDVSHRQPVDHVVEGTLIGLGIVLLVFAVIAGIASIPPEHK